MGRYQCRRSSSSLGILIRSSSSNPCSGAKNLNRWWLLAPTNHRSRRLLPLRDRNRWYPLGARGIFKGEKISSEALVCWRGERQARHDDRAGQRARRAAGPPRGPGPSAFEMSRCSAGKTLRHGTRPGAGSPRDARSAGLLLGSPVSHSLSSPNT
jgi:hypothetical protein